MLAAMGYITPEQLAGRVTTGMGRGEGEKRMPLLVLCLHGLWHRSGLLTFFMASCGGALVLFLYFFVLP